MRSLGQDDGYAMAALLVAMGIMAVMLTIAMPTYKQMARREKEEELVFRGQQYARAIGLFQRKYANAFPPNVDVLVRERFLRKKYKDPITNDDFALLTQAQPNAPGSGSATTARPGMTATSGNTGSTTGTRPLGSTASGGFGTNLGSGGGGGIMGVSSKSKDTSIRIYNGRTHYNEWAFIATQQMVTPGAGAPGRPGQPGQPGRPGQPGQPGTPGRPGQGQQRTSPGGFGYRVGPNGDIQSFGNPPTRSGPNSGSMMPVPATAPTPRRPGG